MLQRHAALIDHHSLTAALEAGVEREHAAAPNRGLEEQVAEVAGEHLHGVALAGIGHLPADLPLETGKHEPGEGVMGTPAEKLGVRMIGRHEHLVGCRLHLLGRPLDPHPQKLGPLAAIDRQESVCRDAVDPLAVVEVVAEVLLVLRQSLADRLHPLASQAAGPLENASQPLPQIDSGTKVVGDDVPYAEQHIGGGWNFGVGGNEVGRPRVEIGSRGLGSKNFPGQRLEPPLSGDLREREPPWLVGQIEILELLEALRRGDLLLQACGQPALPLDRPQNSLLAVEQLPGPGDALLHSPHGFLVEAAGPIPPVAGDEGNRVARIEQLDGGLDAGYG